MKERIYSFFKLNERGSSISKELIGGLVTFLAMLYILPVNSSMLSVTGMPLEGVFISTAIAAAIATLIMGIVANYPIALAPGMGVNAFMTYTVCLNMEFTWQEALAAIFISSVIFIIVSITGLRRTILNAIPKGLKICVGAGIGFLFAFIGLKNGGIIASDPSTLVKLGNLSNPIALLTIFGLLVAIILYSLPYKIKKFSLIISILVTGLLGVILGLLGVDNMPQMSALEYEKLGSGFGEVFGACFQEIPNILSKPAGYVVIFSFLFMIFFDTAGTLLAVGSSAKLLDEDGNLVDTKRVLLADSLGTVSGAICGTSTITSFVESSTGVEAGARTGLSSVFVSILFLLAIVCFPVLSLAACIDVNGVSYTPVTSMALILVGVLMMKQLKGLDFDDLPTLISGFFIILFTILTYSIAIGIAVGLFFYPIVMLCQKRVKEIHPVMWAFFAITILYLVLNTLVETGIIS